MNVYTHVSKAESYRRYADELRAIADALRSAETRRVLYGVADDFYRMASAAESVKSVNRSKRALQEDARASQMSEAAGPRSD
jgi:hypothetical protein